MIGDTGCCGFNVHEKGPNLVGLLTLSVPMMILCVVCFPIIYVLSFLSPKLKTIKNQVLIIIRANMRMIHKKKFFPLFRCKVAGVLFPLSPQISGIVYKSFNLTMFILMWMCILFPFYVLTH